MAPFEHQLLDVRTYGSSLESLEVSIEEEFVKYHVTFFILGIIMMSLASLLSMSLVFYYGSGMAIGVVPCNIDGTFAGDEASPNWSEEFSCNFHLWLVWDLLSSATYLGYCVHYSQRVELAKTCIILQDVLIILHYSISLTILDFSFIQLAIFLLAFDFLAGAWLGVWAVRKLVLAEDGSIEIMTFQFVNWSIKILGATVFFQSSVDHLLATEDIVFGFVVSAILKKIFRWRFLRLVCKYLAFQFWSFVMAFQYLPTFPSSVSTG